MTDDPTVGVLLPPSATTELLSGRSDLPSLLDNSGADYVIIGADLALDDAGVNPTVAATVLARRTERIGLVIAAAPQRDHPFNIARRVASLDHVSAGRAGLLGVTRDPSLAAGIGVRSSWVDADIGPAELADALGAVRALWRTWPISSLDADPTVVGASRIHFADHVGIFTTRGPLNVPTTPQGEPLIFWSLPAPADLLTTDVASALIADVVLIDAAHIGGGITAGLRESPVQPRIHVRTTTAAEASELLTSTTFDGVLISPGSADLRALLGRQIPALTGNSPRHVILRERLGVPRRNDPDLSSHPVAFPEGIVPVQQTKEPV